MRILLTNDDGYKAQGLEVLARCMKKFGEVTVVAPKYHQSGASMAVSMGFKPVAAKRLPDRDGVRWWYVDATPSSCVKYGLDEVFTDNPPDIVVSGINHGTNAASATLYSATVGAAKEGALAGIPSFAFSLDDLRPHCDFSAVEEWLPKVLEPLLQTQENPGRKYYNINFPALPSDEIKGIKVCPQGTIHWVKEFRDYDPGIYERIGVSPKEMGIFCIPEPEPGEKVFMMAGDIADDPSNPEDSDHRQMAAGWITICPQKIDCTDYEELDRLRKLY